MFYVFKGTIFPGVLLHSLLLVVFQIATVDAARISGGNLIRTGVSNGTYGKDLGLKNSSANLTKNPVNSLQVSLLSINTWHEGTKVQGGFQMLVNIIATANPHVVVLSEVFNYYGIFYSRLQSALAAKGKIYHGAQGVGDTALLSLFPISKVENVFSTIVAYHLSAPWPLVVCAAHLDWSHYAPVMPRGYYPNAFVNGKYQEIGYPVTDVHSLLNENAASQRGPAIQAFLSWVKFLGATPVILAGDFNECSHLDWTQETARERDHNGAAPAWPHSLMLANAGFQDTWRELYRDPKTYPGTTWPSKAEGVGNTGWAPKADERDRIDFVYHNNALKATDVRLAGTPFSWIRGEMKYNPWFDPFLISTLGLPWPSDHRGLYAEFTLAKPKPLSLKVNKQRA